LKIQILDDIRLSNQPLYSLWSMPSQKRLMAGGLDPFLFSIRKPGDQFEINPVNGLETSVYCLQNSPDHKWLYLGGAKGILQYFKLEDEKIIYSQYIGSSPIFFLEFIPQTENLLIGSGNGELKILKGARSLQGMESYNLGNSPSIESLKLSNEALRCIAIHPKKPILAIGGKDSLIRILNMETLEIIKVLDGHSLPVFSLAFSPDGNLLISGSRDAQIKIWDIQTFQSIHTIPAHYFAVNHLLMHPTEPYFLSASMDKTIKVWGLDDSKLYKILDLEKTKGHSASVNRLAWSDPFFRSFSSISDDRKLKNWEIEF